MNPTFHERIGLVLRKGNNFYKIGTLSFSKDRSIYLTLRRFGPNPKGNYGKFRVNQGRWSVHFDHQASHKHIVHSSVHAITGKTHTKTASDTQKYLAKGEGMPLSNLTKMRPLWTLVPRITPDRVEINFQPKSNDFIIEEPERINGRALYLFAAPSGDMTFDFEDEINEDGSLPDFGVFHFDLPDYALVLFLNSNKRMTEPQRTIKIPGYRDSVPWVETINEEAIEGGFRSQK